MCDQWGYGSHLFNSSDIQESDFGYLDATFSEYADACRLHGHKVVPIYNLNRLPDRGRLIWLCNPNNPTGEVREKEVLTACIKQNPQRIFVMDQSYESYTECLRLSQAARFEFDCILLHSMTKRFAVPGLRLGYITACKELLHEIRTQRMPWSVNQLL